MWIIVVIIVIIAIIALANRSGSGGGTNSADDAALLFSYFEKIRSQYFDGARNCKIIIGSPIVDINGTSVLSGHLAAYVSEEDASNSDRAQALGMETKLRDGKYEYQYVIRKKFSKQAKQQILQEVGIRIQQTYSNDFITYDAKLPLLMVITDLKDFVEMTQKARQ